MLPAGVDPYGLQSTCTCTTPQGHGHSVLCIVRSAAYVTGVCLYPVISIGTAALLRFEQWRAHITAWITTKKYITVQTKKH